MNVTGDKDFLSLVVFDNKCIYYSEIVWIFVRNFKSKPCSDFISANRTTMWPVVKSEHSWPQICTPRNNKGICVCTDYTSGPQIEDIVPSNPPAHQNLKIVDQICKSIQKTRQSLKHVTKDKKHIAQKLSAVIINHI